MQHWRGFPPYTGRYLTTCWVKSLQSTLHRTGEVVFNYENGSLVIGAQAATQKLRGTFEWMLDFKFLAPRGKIYLQIDYLDVKLGLSQPINVQKKPRLEVLQVSLGNIQVKYIQYLYYDKALDNSTLPVGSFQWSRFSGLSLGIRCQLST